MMMEFLSLFTQHAGNCVLAIPPLAAAAIIGAAIGGAKHFLVNKPKADREREYQSQTARWSPWTGIQSKYVEEPNFFDSMGRGASMGMGMGQGLGGGQSSFASMAAPQQIMQPKSALGVDYSMPQINSPYAASGPVFGSYDDGMFRKMPGLLASR